MGYSLPDTIMIAVHHAIIALEQTNNAKPSDFSTFNIQTLVARLEYLQTETERAIAHLNKLSKENE